MRKIGILLMAIVMVFLLSACTIDNTNYTQQDEIKSETDIESSSESAPEPNVANTEETEKYNTDWDNFECMYFGDIPVGLLTVPDATFEEVEKYVNERLGTNKTFEIHETYNVYQAYQVEMDNIFNFYGHSGQAIFQFDWNGTLSNIVFEFDTESGITPETMQQIHNDLEKAFNSENAWMLDEQPNWGTTTDCIWLSKYNDTPFDIRLSSIFSKSNPIKNEIEFERTVTRVSMNYDVVDDTNGGKNNNITQNELTIKATYHGGSNPYVSGSITNHSDSTVKFIRVKVALLDSSENVIDTAWTYAIGAEGLNPGETSQWKIYCSEADSIQISLMD